MCDSAILDGYFLGYLLWKCGILYDSLLNYSHGSDVFLIGLLNNNGRLALVVVVGGGGVGDLL